jgi:hypothetical protein
MNKITLLVAAFLFTTSIFAQIKFEQKSLINLGVLETVEIYDAKTYLQNNATDPADTLMIWKVIDKKLGDPSWELNVCTGGVCVTNAPGDVEYIHTVGKAMEFKIGFGFYDKPGEGEFKVAVRSKLHPEIADTVYMRMKTKGASISGITGKSFHMYPNPANNQVKIDFVHGGKENVVVYSIFGTVLMTKTILSGDTLDISKLTSGVYIVRTEGNTSFSKVLHKN